MRLKVLITALKYRRLWIRQKSKKLLLVKINIYERKRQKRVVQGTRGEKLGAYIIYVRTSSPKCNKAIRSLSRF